VGRSGKEIPGLSDLHSEKPVDGVSRALQGRCRVPWMIFTSSHAAVAGLSAGFPVWRSNGDFIGVVWSRPGLLHVFHVKRPVNL
jgi:hypothetical protein